jgi:gliding motility-associated lipoprotein GldK
MTTVPSGTFHLGQSDEDVAATHINYNKQVTIGGFYMDDSEITNNEYRQFAVAMAGNDTVGIGRLTAEEVNSIATKKFLPDTAVWMRDFTYHMGDPLMQYYYFHPAFDDYPVVGVNWKQAKLFCKWRTGFLNKSRADRGEFGMPNFRLPSEAEWEYAARGGRDLSPYPWGGPYIRNAKGCLLANFKPGRGNYPEDGGLYTVKADAYFPNDYGLYNMSGNVAEWTLTAYYENAYSFTHDLNPDIRYDAEDTDAPENKRKVIRGGSWKDIHFFLQNGTRSWEYQDTTKSYIGFRCALTFLGRSINDF